MKFLNSIWFLVLLFASCIIISQFISEEEGTLEKTTVSVTIPQIHRNSTIANSNIPPFPIAELGGMNWTFCYKDFSSRAQRTLNSSAYNISSQNNEKEAVYRVGVLTKHRCKYCRTSVASITYPTCDYYVFALRHIVI